MVEIMASIGGLIFLFYLLGKAVFTLYANFLLENDLTSRLYKNLG